MRYGILRTTALLAVSFTLLSACSSDDDDATTNRTSTTGTSTNGTATAGTGTDGSSTDGTTTTGNSVFVPDASDITDVDAFYDQDGYDAVDVIRVDVRTVTTEGVCTIDDQSGCTLDDVIADTDPDDDFKVEIPIHFQSSDFPDDGSISNATLRQRGGTSRSYPQKSFRVKLDSKDVLWRNERRLQLNKHPNEHERIRNKLAFDMMRELPHLPSLRSQFVNLWIDDGQGPEDYGLFTHIEFAGKEYLLNRELDKDNNLYKVEFLNFSQGDLDNLQVDAEGKPLDEDRFESRLDIKRGEDHRPLVNMLTALNDPSQSFESVLERYFNANNVLMWITANFLLHQTDAVTHNFYLYNPVGSEKIYFLPWDYDDTFNPESVLSNSYDNDELSKRLFYGYARGSNSQFISRYYQLPGIHEKILAAANELRNTWLTDSTITERAERYSLVVDPFLSRSPDIEFNPKYNINASGEFAGFVNSIHESMKNDFAVPLPPRMFEPELLEDNITFSWAPAVVVPDGNSLSYDLEIASSLGFEPDNIVLSIEGIADSADLVTYTVDTSSLQSGQLYARLTARASSDPQKYWQVASNTLIQEGTTWFGQIAFTVP